MIDLFGIARDFPGLGDSENDAAALDRVRYLEGRCREDLNDGRFIPYLQLHEFEALLLSEIELLAYQYPSHRRSLQGLVRSVRSFPTPEHVNKQNPPSYRIRRAVPEYAKVVAGVATIDRIGLDIVRQRCGHFGQWLRRLESLGT